AHVVGAGQGRAGGDGGHAGAGHPLHAEVLVEQEADAGADHVVPVTEEVVAGIAGIGGGDVHLHPLAGGGLSGPGEVGGAGAAGEVEGGAAAHRHPGLDAVAVDGGHHVAATHHRHHVHVGDVHVGAGRAAGVHVDGVKRHVGHLALDLDVPQGVDEVLGGH